MLDVSIHSLFSGLLRRRRPRKHYQFQTSQATKTRGTKPGTKLAIRDHKFAYHEQLMSRGAHHTPYGRFLNAQDPHERADALRFFFPTCAYNNNGCNRPRGVRADGRPYRMCDEHRARHRREQQRFQHGRRQRLRMMDVDAALGVAPDPIAIWPDERAFGEELAALLHAPTPAILGHAPADFDFLHDEADGDDDYALDAVDSLLELLP